MEQPDMTLRPLIVHPLPAAPTFTGREAEIEALHAFWGERSGVLSLIGLGGAGKTALAQRFIETLLATDPPDGLLVWSFYEEPDANGFLQTAYQYFTGGQTADARGAGWFHLLKDALSGDRRYLLVLDGLERIQRQQTSVAGIYGELEDPLLRGYLTRLAAGTGCARAIITSRFPISDLERWRGRGYTLIEVEYLTLEAARALLRSHGVRGDDPALDRLRETYGGHALTLDLLGGALARFFEGDPEKGPALEAAEEGTTQEQRLAAVLRLYEERLPPRQLALLCRLCIFRFGVDADALQSIFLGADRKPNEIDVPVMIAGALAGATRHDLESDLEDLVLQHLILRDGRGKYSIHPAVRDHFYRLFRDPASLHNAVREHLSSLTNRPGIGLPTDKATLDLLEELIHHALQAGNVREAEEIYRHRLGANDHLNARLGEYARTYRILRAFPECPDASGMYHCLRAFGRFEEALKWRPQNRYIRLLNGALTALHDDPAEKTRSFARFLQGEPVAVPDRSPDMPVPSAMLHLYRSATDDARRVADNERQLSLYADDTARNCLMLAEAARRDLQPQQSREFIETASRWILRSGSQEHLCLLHLIRARLAMDEKNLPVAQAALEEGLHIAQDCDFLLLKIELLIEQARLRMSEGDLTSAENAVAEALALARSPECLFAWGEAEAGHLLGEIWRIQGRKEEARAAFEEARTLRKRIGDPAVMLTERALRQLE
jgi:predicted negative regulator of RcsB-dependent stress response